MTPQKEPALYAGFAAVVGLLIVYGILTTAQADAWLTVISALVVPMLQAWWTRRKVMPVDTIRDAGLNPERVKERAEDWTVPRNTEGERA